LPGFQPYSQVNRRYRQFKKFLEKLAEIRPALNIPRLPEAGLFVDLKDRQKKLLAWLKLLSQHREFEVSGNPLYCSNIYQ
jgi:hypothetical protein